MAGPTPLATWLADNATDVALTYWSANQDRHAPYSDFVERYYLPSLGPAGVFAWRRLIDAAAAPAPAVNLADLAQAIGLGRGTGAASKVVRTIDRLARFQVVRFEPGQQSIGVRALAPDLTPRQVGRLPEYLRRQLHEEVTRAR